MKRAKEIDFLPGSTIDRAVERLRSFKKKGVKAYGFFNRAKLTTKDNRWKAYKKVTGKTAPQWDRLEERRSREYEERKRKHEEAIPVLTEKYINEGRQIIAEKYHSEWERCVPIRLNDLYEGMELRCCLDIVKSLNNGCPIQFAIGMIESQGHSGISYSLVRSMVCSFCDRGEEFYQAAK